MRQARGEPREREERRGRQEHVEPQVLGALLEPQERGVPGERPAQEVRAALLAREEHVER